jgi:hypothetical protein
MIIVAPFKMFVATYLMLMALCSIPFVSAFNNITTDPKINANQDFIIMLDNDFANGIQSYDRQYDSFRVALSVNTTDGQFELYCYLVNSSAMGVPMITAKIPSSIGENGPHYRIEVQAFNQDPNNRTVNNSSEGIMQPSQPFDLEATTGKWAEFEQDGDMIGWPAYIPCEEYDCVRTCYQSYYPTNLNNEHSGKFCDMRSTWSCARDCPGTSFPTWEESDDGRRCLAAQASSSSVAAANSKTSSLSTTSSVFMASASTGHSGVISTKSSTATTSPSSSAAARVTSSSGRLSPTGTPTAAARATAVPSLAPAVRSSMDVSTLLGAGILGFFVVNWY